LLCQVNTSFCFLKFYTVLAAFRGAMPGLLF
jgi:hypothetical protein